MFDQNTAVEVSFHLDVSARFEPGYRTPDPSRDETNFDRSLLKLAEEPLSPVWYYQF
jgi:hypothetical protein